MTVKKSDSFPVQMVYTTHETVPQSVRSCIVVLISRLNLVLSVYYGSGWFLFLSSTTFKDLDLVRYFAIKSNRAVKIKFALCSAGTDRNTEPMT